ncbi:hypothetical protein ACOYW6_04015 [Parablastomonas sp. CN1-191]|uniref:hypothetical protein n=1 Tax=Parablastomonas sp. CN1-191 TaxID=3400908 RepID=UPI003BF7E5B6
MGRTTVLATVLTLVPVTAQAAEPPCLAPAEFSAVSSYALPSLIRGAISRCGPSLPSTAFLRTSGEALARKYDAGRIAAWPTAKAAFLKVGTIMNPQVSGLFGAMPDSALRPMVDGSMVNMVGQRLPIDRCTSLDRAIELVAPLPAANAAKLVGIAAGLWAGDGRARLGQFSVCKT